jgi:hypothetical protein
MTTIEIKSSRGKYIALLIGSIGFVAGGAFILLIDGPMLIGWMSIIIFGASIPLFTWQIFDRRPRLKIDDTGILDRTLGVGKIAWDDINDAFVKSIHSNDFVCLKLTDPEKYVGKLNSIKKAMTKANEKLGFTPISLNLSGVAVNTHEILELIMKTIEIKKNKNG